MMLNPTASHPPPRPPQTITTVCTNQSIETTVRDTGMCTHQVAGEDDLGTLIEEELDGGDGRADASVVGDLLGVVERHVEVGAHEHLLPLQIRLPEGAHAPLGRHHSLHARTERKPGAAGIRLEPGARRRRIRKQARDRRGGDSPVTAGWKNRIESEASATRRSVEVSFGCANQNGVVIGFFIEEEVGFVSPRNIRGRDAGCGGACS